MLCIIKACVLEVGVRVSEINLATVAVNAKD
jgi:hypothetical protein